MNSLNENYVYDLSELTSEEKEEVGRNIFKPENIKNAFNYNYVKYIEDSGSWFATSTATKTTNAKELFYTLENVQVDCSDLTEERIKEMADVFKTNGYEINSLFLFGEYSFIRNSFGKYCSVVKKDKNKIAITYEKLMELFGNKEKSEEFNNLVEVLNEELTEEAYKETEYEVKYIAEKPKQYQIGIDTFNPQPHYNNENGSLYKIATDLGLNHWEFDIFKRLVRCRKKNQFKEDLQKIKDTIDIYLNEYSE